MFAPKPPILNQPLLINSCTSPNQELNWVPEFLEIENAFFLTELSNTVLPNTEFPGAVALGVPEEIEKYVFNVYDEDDINKFMEDLNTLKTYLFEKLFYNLTLAEKTSVLNSIQKMKKGVRIINCARGGIIIEQDLKEALDSGKVAGACLTIELSNAFPSVVHPV